MQSKCMFKDATTREQLESRKQMLQDGTGTRIEPPSPPPSSPTTSAVVEVCWDLEKRGNVGETALHLALLLSQQPKFRQIAVALLNAFPKLSVDVYERDEYYGYLLDLFESTFVPQINISKA